MGATFHERAAAVPHAVRGDVDLCFVRYNPVHPGARRDLFPAIENRRSRVFNFMSTLGPVDIVPLDALGLAPARWRYQLNDDSCLGLTSPAIDGMPVAADTSAHVEGRARSVVDVGTLDDEEQQYLVDLSLLATGHAAMGRMDSQTLEPPL